MERQEANKVRIRKISFYHKIASNIKDEISYLETNMPSYFQCINTSLGYIDENGKILLIDSIENPYDSRREYPRIPKYDHSEFILQDLCDRDSDKYNETKEFADNRWVKVSNMNQISCMDYPSYEQLRSFAIIHYLCTKKCGLSPMNSEESIYIYSESSGKNTEMNIGDLIHKYGGEELEDLYYGI